MAVVPAKTTEIMKVEILTTQFIKIYAVKVGTEAHIIREVRQDVFGDWRTVETKSFSKSEVLAALEVLNWKEYEQAECNNNGMRVR